YCRRLRRELRKREKWIHRFALAQYPERETMNPTGWSPTKPLSTKNPYNHSLHQKETGIRTNQLAHDLILSLTSIGCEKSERGEAQAMEKQEPGRPLVV